MFNNQIIGITRFSIPSTDAFEISQQTMEACEALLYDPARLNARFDLFERFCLPSLVQQSDKDFIGLILIGQNLPKPAFDRLMDLTLPHDHLCLAKVDPAPHFKMINKVVQELPKIDATHRTTFRLDDDDMVDLGYVERMRATLDHMAPLSMNAPLALAHHSGFYLDLAKETPTFYEATENLPPSMALSVTAPMTWRSNIYAWNHRFVPKKCNTYIDTRTPAFIRTMHGLNDAPRNASYDSKPVEAEKMKPVLEDTFGITWADLQRPITGPL